MKPELAAPSQREREAQLQRILASRTFEKYLRLRQFLERLVGDDLAGKPVDEDTLGRDLFRRPKDWNPMEQTVVRQGLRNLREKLQQYYLREGQDDPVIIDFPKRNEYRPRYAHNVRSDAVERVRRAAYRLHQTFPELLECGNVAAELETCIELHPSHAPAYAMLAEVLLLGTLCEHTLGFSPRESVPRAAKAAEKCLQLDERLWQAHVSMGAIHCCRFQWEKADKAFEAALAIAPEEARAHFWYAAFLMAVGRTEEAKQCVSWRVKSLPQDRFTKNIVPLFRYVMRDFKQAYDELTVQSPSYYLYGIQNDMRYFCGDVVLECDNWLEELLLACLTLALNHANAAWKYAEAATAHSKAGAFNGLVVLAYTAHGKGYDVAQKAADSLLERLEKDARWTGPVSLALAYMGMGRTEEAIVKLREACNDHHPLLVWMHLWPIFDPLREHKRFKALVRRMRLPVPA